jgi:Epoxide hydrolase N terminus
MTVRIRQSALGYFEALPGVHALYTDIDRRREHATKAAAPANETIRPFRVNFSDAELTELRRRISATQWPDRETAIDQSQGPQLATMQKLARYWATEYDWRKVEARLNGLPNFVTEIDRLDISTSFTFVRNTRTRCRSSSQTAGPARLSSS